MTKKSTRRNVIDEYGIKRRAPKSMTIFEREKKEYIEELKRKIFLSTDSVDKAELLRELRMEGL